METDKLEKNLGFLGLTAGIAPMLGFIGTISGIKMAYPKQRLGAIWIDAHADMHSPFTTPTGNMHGMPLATALGEDNAINKINKVDKENCTPEEVHEKVFDLFFHLDATEDQLGFPTVYGSSKQGWMSYDYKNPTTDVTALLDTIVDYIPCPEVVEGTPQMLITSLDFSSYVGRIAIGRISRGSLKENQPVTLMKRDGTMKKSRIKEIFVFEGLGRRKAEVVTCGDLCAVTGIEDFDIGDTIADFENPEALTPISVDEPTMCMLFTINNSPFFGKEGRFVTSRHVRDRLYKELEKNLAMRVVETESPDAYLVYGRGVLHLSILIETMRREGYELQVGQPQVIIKEIDGQRHEPVEHLTVDTPEEVAGKVIELVTQKKGELKIMEPKGDLQHLEFEIPAQIGRAHV